MMYIIFIYIKQEGRKMSSQGLSIFHLHQTADQNRMGFQCTDILLPMILITEIMKMAIQSLQIMFKVRTAPVVEVLKSTMVSTMNHARKFHTSRMDVF